MLDGYRDRPNVETISLDKMRQILRSSATAGRRLQARKEESGIGDVTSGGLDVDTPVDEVKVVCGLRLVRSCRQPVAKECDEYSPLVTLATTDDSDASDRRE
jgi:hypothetical protein